MREVARILEAGRPTPFRWESACRHGLRAALCLKGWRWDAADGHAARVVSLALARVGATLRPPWRVSQPEAVEREFRWCASCGGYSADGNDRPWCSDECRNVMKMRDWWHAGRDEDAARERARRIAFTGTAEQPSAAARHRSCRGCGKSFAVPYSNPKTVYCSHRCWTQADRRHPRDCIICAAPFMSKGAAKYCSPACIAEGSRRSHRAAAARKREKLGSRSGDMMPRWSALK